MPEEQVATQENPAGASAEAEGGDQTSSSYEDMDKDTLITELKAKEQAAKDSETNRREFQSVYDKQFNEMRESQAELRGQVEGFQKAASRTSSDNTLKEQEEFDADWKQKIADDPSSIIEFLRGSLGEVDKRQDQKLEKVLASIQSQLQTSDPGYRDNKEVVDKVMDETGIKSIEVAKKVAAMLKSQSTPAHPETSPPPGITEDGTRAAPAAETTHTLQNTPSLATATDVMRRVGMSDESIKKAVADTAKAAAGS